MEPLRFFYCPVCGDREQRGCRCLCGLLWTDARCTFKHRDAPRLLSDVEAEEMRHKIGRRKTLSAVQSLCFGCSTRRIVANIWRDPALRPRSTA